MIIINTPAPNTSDYVISFGESNFCVYAQNEDDAIDTIAEHFVTHGKSDWYFSVFEVEFIAKSTQKTVADFIADSDLRYCPKQNIYLPKIKITVGGT